MATLCVCTNEENFSRIINKNPATGMIAKSLKKGYIFGYFSSDNQYNIAFFDGMDENSFAPNQDFEYKDVSRYNSPLFVFNGLKAFFSTAINNPNEFDHPGQYTINITSIEIKKVLTFMQFNKFFKDFEITNNLIPHEETEYYNNYNLIISTKTKTLGELLGFTYMLSFFIILLNKIDFYIDNNSIKKVLNIANKCEAPYYIKYLIKFFSIKNTETFNIVKDELNFDKHHKLDFKSSSNENIRYLEISNFISSKTDRDIVDFGCGEGRYLSLAKKVNHYYAIDKNEEALNIFNKKVVKKQFDNVTIFNDLQSLEINSDYTVIMSEVIEHNTMDDLLHIFEYFSNDKHCKQILITTPNKDFNKFYLLGENEKRHEDHIFEWNKQEIVEFFDKLNIPFDYKIKNIGDEVDDISTSFMVVLNRRD